MITVKAIAQAALKAHAEGRLCAQNKNDAPPFYANPDKPGIGCAIGVAVPADTALELEHLSIGGYEIDVLCRDHPDVIQIDDPVAARELQHLHDRWYNQGPIEDAFLAYAQKLAQEPQQASPVT